ncbi:MAG: pur operon repressor [Firmicutes bacterium]|nr:pur operon repressor [Bacillota bacterium]
MKRTERIGALIRILSECPSKPYSLQYFCDLFGCAKSSISEDIQTASHALKETGTGYLETIPGAKGGVKFVPDISNEDVLALQQEFCERLRDTSRLLGGNFVYTSDIFYDHGIVSRLSKVFARKFRNCGANYVATVETKGIPLAYNVAHLLNLPLIVIRREARISEGSTVSINYFSGSYDRLQKMSMSKRAIKADSKVLIIDDFMRGGGSVTGIKEMIGEFGGKVVGIGIAIVAKEPEKKKVSDYSGLIYLGEVSSEKKIIEAIPNTELF